MYMCCFINTVLKLSLTATEMHMGIKRNRTFSLYDHTCMASKHKNTCLGSGIDIDAFLLTDT